MISLSSSPGHAAWPAKCQIHAGAMSLVMLSLALLTLWLGHWLATSLPEKIEVREVGLILPPASPPPPPTVRQQAVITPLSIQVQGAGVTIPPIDVKQKIDLIKPHVPSLEPRQTQWQSLEIEWNAVALNQLDGLPRLITPLRVKFPSSLRRQGIKGVLVKLDVVIDAQGKVTLVNIVENPHPELVAELQHLVRNSRFSAPKKDNQPVRARFIWPVDIKS